MTTAVGAQVRTSPDVRTVPAGSGDERPLRSPRRAIEIAGAAALYCVLACLRFWPVAPWDGTRVPHHATNDAAQSVWYLAWTAHALAHGLNPLFSGAVNAPVGANMAANTSTPALGLLAAPVTLLFGPVTAMNLLLRLGLAGSAFAMFLFLRRRVRWWPAAVLGGALFGFNAFTLRESGFHLHLEFLVVPPLLLWALDELLVVQRRRPVPTGAVLGALVVVQWFINQEVLADCALLAVLGCALLALWHRRAVRRRLHRALPGLVTASAVCVTVLAYPVWFMVAGPQHLRGPTQAAAVLNGFHLDLLAPLVRGIRLTTTVPGGIPGAPHHEAAFSYVLSEGYLGLPLVAVVVGLVVAWRRHPLVRFGAWMAALSFLLALGGRLSVLGHRTGVPLPAAVLAHLPLLDEIEPLRFAIFLWLFLALVVAAGTEETYRWLRPRVAVHRPQAVDALVVAVLGISAIPMVVAAPPVMATAVPASRAASTVAEATPVGGTVLYLPPVTKSMAQPMVWQAEASMRYRIVGGYVIVPRDAETSTNFPPPSPALRRLLAGFSVPGATSPEAAAARLAACRAFPAVVSGYHVATVVLWSQALRDPAADRRLVKAALGPASVRRPGLSLWALAGHRARTSAHCGRVL